MSKEEALRLIEKAAKTGTTMLGSERTFVMLELKIYREANDEFPAEAGYAVNPPKSARSAPQPEPHQNKMPGSLRSSVRKKGRLRRSFRNSTLL